MVGAAVAALAGCVSVEAPPTRPAPAPAAETVRPTQRVAPQIVEGPAREALEAALPAPPPSTPPPPEARHRPPAPVRPQDVHPRWEQRPHPAVRPALPEPPSRDLAQHPPLTRADVCGLGERYGSWVVGSAPSKICRDTYGR
nr:MULTISPECIES: hypothetical protein [unclassified Streptomyces]